jgi:saccharopine dehydrogenase-like NADP-dependent oxidoreductase
VAPRIAVVGPGAVGRRVAEHLAGSAEVVVVSRRPGLWERSVRELALALPADVTVLTVSDGARRSAAAAIESGSHVVSPLDDPAEVAGLVALGARAQAKGVTVAVGTAMAPGLSCLLAARLADDFDRVEEIHVASFGTGGPACARRHHAALTGVSVDWADGRWVRRPSGSGRELVWFPEPVGGADCYRVSAVDPLLLQPRFPDCRRITSRMAATRRDRLTSWLPMMRPPHPEGLVGAVRVEVRGWVGSCATTRILGAARPPAVVAAAVSATAARWLLEGRIATIGAGGLASLVEAPGEFIRATGVSVATFEGAPV